MGEAIIARGQTAAKNVLDDIPVSGDYCSILVKLTSSSGYPCENTKINCKDGSRWYNYTTNEAGYVLFKCNSGAANISANNWINGIFTFDQNSFGTVNIDAPVGTKILQTIKFNQNNAKFSSITPGWYNGQFRGIDKVKNVILVGGGGGGGGGGANKNYNTWHFGNALVEDDAVSFYCGGGGGGGAKNYSDHIDIIKGQWYNIYIGAGGKGGSYDTAANSGGSSSGFGLIANGGEGGGSVIGSCIGGKGGTGKFAGGKGGNGSIFNIDITKGSINFYANANFANINNINSYAYQQRSASIYEDGVIGTNGAGSGGGGAIVLKNIQNRHSYYNYSLGFNGAGFGVQLNKFDTDNYVDMRSYQTFSNYGAVYSHNSSVKFADGSTNFVMHIDANNGTGGGGGGYSIELELATRSNKSYYGTYNQMNGRGEGGNGGSGYVEFEMG